jgi:hypothetical protein
MNEIFDRVTQMVGEAIGKVKISSALNSSLWLCAIITIPCLFSLAFAKEAFYTPIIILMFIPISLYGISHLYFMVKDPDKLRSEDYEIRKQALSLIQEKGGRIPIGETSVVDIANPNYTPLPGREDPEVGQ